MIILNMSRVFCWERYFQEDGLGVQTARVDVRVEYQNGFPTIIAMGES